uniref:Ubiquitin-conjugating enzyme E2 Z n=1 Tax=Macrostomum lignano TaxID=282301 RepID=A0A1I8G871_9PLAT
MTPHPHHSPFPMPFLPMSGEPMPIPIPMPMPMLMPMPMGNWDAYKRPEQWDPDHPSRDSEPAPSRQCLKRFTDDLRRLCHQPQPLAEVFPDEDCAVRAELLLRGGDGTPYAGGFFHFSVRAPPDYPQRPPYVAFRTASHGDRVRFHPNFYERGCVCMSILNTWGECTWDSSYRLENIIHDMQFRLDDQPLKHEPAPMRECEQSNQHYNDQIAYETLRIAVCQQLEQRSLPPALHLSAARYFVDNFDAYLGRCHKLKKRLDGLPIRNVYNPGKETFEDTFEFAAVAKRLEKSKPNNRKVDCAICLPTAASMVRLLALSLLLACLLGPARCQGSISSSASSSSSTDVRIRVSVSEHLVTLSCDVIATGAGADDHKVQFYCPVLSSSLQCFGECSPICNMQSDGSCPVIDPILVSGVSCDRTVRPPDAKTVSLTVDTRLSRLAGAWSCKFRGAVSATVDLTAYVMKTTFAPTQPMPTGRRGAAAAAESPPTSAPAAADLGVWKPDVRRFPADLAATQDDFDRHPNLAKFARTDYIIGVLAVMSASLLLNLGFCVRCILARHYVETRRRNQRKPLGWLGSCLCVSTVQDDAGSDISASGGGAGSRLALSRRMLRKADTLLREANSLLVETEPTTDQSPE